MTLRTVYYTYGTRMKKDPNDRDSIMVADWSESHKQIGAQHDGDTGRGDSSMLARIPHQRW